MPRTWTALEDKDLTPMQKLVYACLCKFQGKNEDCFPSHRTIARYCGADVSTVKRAIRVLVAKKYIEKRLQKRPDGGWTSNRYRCIK